MKVKVSDITDADIQRIKEIRKLEGYLVHRYEVVDDYCPLITQKGGILAPTKTPVLFKGDILIPMNQHKGDTRFKSTKDKDAALYEYTILNYPDVFKKLE